MDQRAPSARSLVPELARKNTERSSPSNNTDGVLLYQAPFQGTDVLGGPVFRRAAGRGEEAGAWRDELRPTDVWMELPEGRGRGGNQVRVLVSLG